MTNREALLLKWGNYSNAEMAVALYNMIDAHDSTCALCPAFIACEKYTREAKARRVYPYRPCVTNIAEWLNQEGEE